jgi:hypothetical protein
MRQLGRGCMRCKLLLSLSFSDGHVVSAVQYMLGVCPAAVQDRPSVCDCGKWFNLRQAMRCKC